MGTIQIKRIYRPAEKTDGVRVLIDRLWPRGLKREDIQIHEWLKEVAPSTALRKWAHHSPEKWQEFEAKYRLELEQNDAVNNLLAIISENEVVTLLYAARDQKQNHALVLLEFLKYYKK